MIQYFSQVVEEHAHKYPERLAFTVMGQQTSYRQYAEEINRVANSFLEMGLKPGDKVATILPQSPAFMHLFMAAATMGLIVVPLDPRFTAFEMASLCRRTNPKLLVSLGFPEPIKLNAEKLIEEFAFEHVFSYFGTLDRANIKPYETLLEGSPDPVPKEVHPSPDDPLIIIFTSGSTGVPKGAMISHRNTYAIARATVEAWGFKENDLLLINLPVSHVGGTHDQIAAALYGGISSVLTPTFNPVEYLQIIEEHKITVSGGVPTMFRLIFKQCNVKDYDVNSVRLLILSGEPSPPEFIYKVKENFPNATLAASYGLTETAGFFTFTKPEDSLETVARTEGTPGLGFQMKVLKDDGTWAGPREIGELLVKGESTISSYLDPEDNKDAFYHGWFKTGDLGHLDENGYLHYVGRKKEMYISGGYNVYPLEIETYLNAYPGINASCIIEVPDEMWGEVGYAFIVPEEGIDIDINDLMRYCHQGLADYKRPKRFIIEKDLPKTLIGKIAKQNIRENLQSYIRP